MKKDFPRIFDYFKQKSQNIIKWIEAGKKPPPELKKSFILLAFLLVFGLSCFTFGILSYFGIIDIFIPTLIPFFGTATLTLLPGLYMLWISICSWRNVPGYGWWMIPHVD